MLIELLTHQDELFHDIILFIRWRRDYRTIAALSTVNRRLRCIILALPWWQYYRIMRPSLKSIEDINILQNNYVTIRELCGRVVSYTYFHADNTAYGYATYSTCNMYKIHDWCGRELHRVNYKDNVAIMYHGSHYDNISIKIIGPIPAWILRCPRIMVYRNIDCVIRYIFNTSN
jgi:hypothetical protein